MKIKSDKINNTITSVKIQGFAYNVVGVYIYTNEMELIQSELMQGLSRSSSYEYLSNYVANFRQTNFSNDSKLVYVIVNRFREINVVTMQNIVLFKELLCNNWHASLLLFDSM